MPKKKITETGHDEAVRECEEAGGCGFSPCVEGMLYDLTDALGRLHALYTNGPGPEGCGESEETVLAAVKLALKFDKED